MVPILMYHKVGEPVRRPADRFLNVSSAAFGRQMGLLRRLGCQAITLSEAVRGLTGEAALRRKAVCVTFDDGYANVGQHAAPILAALGWPGTVFVPTAYVGDSNRWDEQTGRPVLPLLAWEQLRQLAAAGWEVAGHTRTHPHLDRLDEAAAYADIAGGRADIEERIGRPPLTFCYPFGDHDGRTPRLVRRAGFLGACTTQSGVAGPTHDPFLLPRVKVAYRDGVAGLLYRLWLRPRLR